MAHAAGVDAGCSPVRVLERGDRAARGDVATKDAGRCRSVARVSVERAPIDGGGLIAAGEQSLELQCAQLQRRREPWEFLSGVVACDAAFCRGLEDGNTARAADCGTLRWSEFRADGSEAGGEGGG